jgi:hypothetical protein
VSILCLRNRALLGSGGKCFWLPEPEPAASMRRLECEVLSVLENPVGLVVLIGVRPTRDAKCVIASRNGKRWFGG